jgi:hypothetical protein
LFVFKGTLATSTQIVWTYIFELAFLHEGINGWSLAGTGLILGFMLIVGFSKMTEVQSKNKAERIADEEAGLLLKPDASSDSDCVASKRSKEFSDAEC